GCGSTLGKCGASMRWVAPRRASAGARDGATDQDAARLRRIKPRVCWFARISAAGTEGRRGLDVRVSRPGAGPLLSGSSAMRKIAVVGLGYVGLAVARAFARRFPDTLGFDRDAERVADLARGRDATGALAEAGALDGLRLTSAPAELA